MTRSMTQTWISILYAFGVTPGAGAMKKLARQLKMDPSNLSAIVRGRRMPTRRSNNGKESETDRLARVFGLGEDEVREVSKRTMRCRKSQKSPR